MTDLNTLNERDAQRSVALQGLAILATLGIMTGHWADFYYPNLLPKSQTSIDTFFAIEGFWAADMLARARVNDSFWSLVRQRLLKIYPLYLLGISLSLALVIPQALQEPSGWTPAIVREALLLNSAMLPSFAFYSFSVFPFNPPSWAIVLEVYAFVAICLVRKLLNLKRLLLLMSAITIGYVAMMILANDAHMGFRARHYWGGYGRCAFGMGWGVLLYHLISRFGPVLPRISPLWVWTIFISMAFVLSPIAAIPLAVVASPLLVWLGAISPNPRWLERFAGQAERLSYGIYLLHYPIIMTFVGYKVLEIPQSAPATLGNYLLVLAAVILVAHAASMLLARTGRSTLKLLSADT